MLRRLLFSLVLLAITMSLGCSWGTFQTSYRRFPLGDKNGEAVALDVYQRIILTRQFAESTRQVVCAEPSPDALQVFSTALAAEVTAKGVTGGFSGASSGAAQALSERSQTLMLLHDAMYRICEGYFNSAFDTAEYRYQHLRYRDSMLALLAIEELAGNKRTPGTVVIPNATNVDVDLANPGDDEDESPGSDGGKDDKDDKDEEKPAAGSGGSGDTPATGTPAPADKKTANRADHPYIYASHALYAGRQGARGDVVPAVVGEVILAQNSAKPNAPAKPDPSSSPSTAKPTTPADGKKTPAPSGEHSQSGDTSNDPKNPKPEDKPTSDAKKSISDAAVEIVRLTLSQNYDKQYCASYLAEEGAERDLICDIGARMVVRYCAKVLGITDRSSTELSFLESYPEYGCSSEAKTVRDEVHLEAMARRKQCHQMGLDNETCTLALKDAHDILFHADRDPPDEASAEKVDPVQSLTPVPEDSRFSAPPRSHEEDQDERVGSVPQVAHDTTRVTIDRLGGVLTSRSGPAVEVQD